jgi:hypothetical protein
LQRLAGNVGCEDVVRVMRCDKCRHTGYLVATAWNPAARERVGLRIRRLADIRMVRKVIWEDDPPG